jgi:D-serine deaminase-like pyridoxal phosphate-dependent protein
MLTTVPTPRVAVDLRRLRANIAAMQALASKAGVRLRPHSKTHKSPAVARWQIDAGAVGICCAKLGEAEVNVARLTCRSCPTARRAALGRPAGPLCRILR